MWTRAPLVPLAIAFGAGIAGADVGPPELRWTAWLTGLGVAALGLGLGRPRLATGALLVGVAAVGALRAAPLDPPADDVSRAALPSFMVVTARVDGEPTPLTSDRTRLTLAVETLDDDARSGHVQVTVYGEPLALVDGQRVRFGARLHRATGFRNPGGYDHTRHLAREGILVVASVRADRLTALDDPGPSWHVRLRRGARAAVERALPPASAALLAGLLLGDRASLPPEIDTAFRRAGVYHVLAVSGFNVALVGGATFALLSLVRFPRRAAAAGALVVVLGFAAVVGPQPSVVRAAIMAVLILGALLLEREASVPNSLALAALAILAVRPGDLLDPGFQLSFAATAGIVAAPAPRGLVVGAIGVSLAAELAVLPITLLHFNQLSLVGPLANLGAVPLAGLATIIGLAGVVASWVAPAAGHLFLDATWPVLIALRGLVAVCAAPGWALLHLPAPAWPAVMAYTAALLFALAWWHLRGARPRVARLAGGVALLALAIALVGGAWSLVRPPDRRLRVTVLDVGQGDAILIETPDGRVLLVDAGGGGPMRLDAGERVIAPVLWNRGVLRLDGAIATHQDADHAGGLGAIRRLFTVRESVRAEELRPGSLVFGGIRITGLADPGAAPTRRGRNEDALVLRLDYGLVSFLLASDITSATEARLLATGAPLAATVLKVAHHGARGSSTADFLKAVDPRVAVISVGARNPYGHPARDTLARLADTGAVVHRTDRDGAVLFETDGRSLIVTRWASREVERYCLDPETVC